MSQYYLTTDCLMLVEGLSRLGGEHYELHTCNWCTRIYIIVFTFLSFVFIHRLTWGENPTSVASATSPLPSSESSKVTSTRPMPSRRIVGVPTASRCSRRPSSRNSTLPSSTAMSVRSVASHSLDLATYRYML